MIGKDLPKYSNRYYDIVQDGRKFHIENKTWSGGGIKNLQTGVEAELILKFIE